MLTIKGQRKTETRAEGAGYRRLNFRTPLIQEILRHGVLEVVVPKHKAVKPRKFEILD